MKTSRLITGLIATALAATPLAMAAPAQAATTYATTTTLAISYGAPSVVAGDTISLTGGVQYATPYGQTAAGTGVATLQVMSSRNPTWVSVATDDSPGYLSFPEVKPQSNSAYRLVYGGGQTANGDVFTPSESVPLAIAVTRKMKVSDKGVTVKGKITPDFGKSKIKITISKKENGKYKKFRTIRTNKKGQFRIKLPARRGGLYFRFLIPGNKHYATTGFGYRTWRY